VISVFPVHRCDEVQGAVPLQTVDYPWGPLPVVPPWYGLGIWHHPIQTRVSTQDHAHGSGTPADPMRAGGVVIGQANRASSPVPSLGDRTHLDLKACWKRVTVELKEAVAAASW
jgi:hypothetical protein